MIEAKSGRQALDIVRDNPGKIDLAILDIVMPNLSGPETHARLKQMLPELPVIFGTGYANSTYEAFLREGNHKTLRKPYRSADLYPAIREMLD